MTCGFWRQRSRQLRLGSSSLGQGPTRLSYCGLTCRLVCRTATKLHVATQLCSLNSLIAIPSLISLPLPADTYLLQIQPYNFSGTTQKPKTEGATIKADSDQSDAGNVVAPATGQKEAVPQWYDVDVVKGTQFTVTGYNVPAETPPAAPQATPTPAANGQEVSLLI